MNRWFFLGGTAVVGLLLYLVFKVSHPGAGDGGSLDVAASREGRMAPGWNDLAAPRLPLPASPPTPLPERSLSAQGGEPERHPLDTKSTVYLDGQGP